MLTTAHFSEINTLIGLVDSFTTPESKTVSDYCLKVQGQCLFDSTNPLFYYYDFANSRYAFDAATNNALLAQLNSGLNKYTNGPINTNELFATTTPPKDDLVQTGGVWNLEKAVGGT